MNLSGLRESIAALPAISSLHNDTVGGLLRAARPAVIAALGGGHTVVLTAHPQEGREMAEELEHWSDRPVLYFPPLEILPYERGRLDRTVLAEREGVLAALAGDEPVVVVAPARAVLQPVRPTRAQSLASTVLSLGDTIQLDDLLRSWVEGGYTETGVVDEPGTFARRGGVIDVFPPRVEKPVRIELFGREIESLRTFDPATQRSIAPVPSVTIYPIGEVTDDARLAALGALMDVPVDGLNAEARTRWMDDLGMLEAGAALEDVAFFGPYLIPNAVSLLDHLREGTVVVDNAAETWEAVRHQREQADELQRELEESGNLPAGLRPALLDPGHIAEAVGARRHVEFVAGTGEDAVDLSGLFVAAPLYGGRMRSLVHDIKESPSPRWVVASYQHERVAELLRDEEIGARQISDLDAFPEPGVTILPNSLAQGWSIPSLGLTVLSDHELFGRSDSRPVVRKPRAAREAFFAQFQPGDYVVHLEHGVGRFEGMSRMTVEGAEREYAVVQYAGADRVYVPSDQLERLTRYIGVGDAAPQLNKLGGGEWQRARQRARQAADEIAGELIDLYAKRQARPGFAFGTDTPWQGELESSFPYPETPGQVEAIEDVKRDMEAPRPMDRLVCADVGYGKTEVAVRAAFKAIMEGKQVAVLVPTTILAQQHFETFNERFEAYPIKVEVLSRFRSPAQQKEILKRVAAGEVDVLIGTHRLLQKDVVFKSLGLLIVDEEQRFGVRHKEHLRKMRETIDTLTLTATPIPRTLHTTLVGIREVSVIETPPEGRLPVKTYLQPFDERLVRQAILRELDRDGQVYLVHNKVATIEAMAERIRRLVPEARVVVAHGQMDEALLERAMLTFAHHEADVLISSTIIENGLDIPNVNTIIINNAHTLGLTQLYQLRGRVGRSANQAYAYLLYPRDANISHDAGRRMEAIFEAQGLGSGFGIAMRDLEIRGAGNLLGAQQSGHAAAVGFDLYTKMIGEAVERLRGVAVEEPPAVTVDVPLTMYLPAEYIGNEAERLTLYRRLASVSNETDLDALSEEMRDRFGPLPEPVANLVTTVRIKLLAAAARVVSVSLSADWLVLRGEPNVLYDRVSLYSRYGMDARISTNVLRVPRRQLGPDWIDAVRTMLADMIRLRSAVARPA